MERDILELLAGQNPKQAKTSYWPLGRIDPPHGPTLSDKLRWAAVRSAIFLKPTLQSRHIQTAALPFQRGIDHVTPNLGGCFMCVFKPTQKFARFFSRVGYAA